MASKAVTAKSSNPDLKATLLNTISTSLESTLSGSFESLKEKLAGAIGDNGEKYLKEAVEKVTDSATQLAKWAKKNPVKTTVAAAGLVAVSAYLYSLAKAHAKETDAEEDAPAKKSSGKKARANG